MSLVLLINVNKLQITKWETMIPELFEDPANVVGRQDKEML